MYFCTELIIKYIEKYNKKSSNVHTVSSYHVSCWRNKFNQEMDGKLCINLQLFQFPFRLEKNFMGNTEYVWVCCALFCAGSVQYGNECCIDAVARCTSVRFVPAAVNLKYNIITQTELRLRAAVYCGCKVSEHLINHKFAYAVFMYVSNCVFGGVCALSMHRNSLNACRTTLNYPSISLLLIIQYALENYVQNCSIFCPLLTSYYSKIWQIMLYKYMSSCFWAFLNSSLSKMLALIYGSCCEWLLKVLANHSIAYMWVAISNWSVSWISWQDFFVFSYSLICTCALYKCTKN